MTIVTRLRKKKEIYEIIIIDNKRSPNSGKMKALLGHYNPHSKEIQLNINLFIWWLSKGVSLTKRIEKIIYDKLNFLKQNEK